MLIAEGQVVGGGIVAIFRPLAVIEKGLVRILFTAQAPLIAVARLALGAGVALGRGFFVQRQGLGIVLGDVPAGKIEVGQAVGGGLVAQVDGSAVEGNCLLGILLHTQSPLIAYAQGPDALGIILLRRPGVELHRPGHVFFHALPMLIVQSQEKLGSGIVLIGGPGK